RTMAADLQEQLLNAIEKTFNYNRRQAEKVYVELIVQVHLFYDFFNRKEEAS
ncbi:unnamed protein product, partial [Rotaria sp. Silwood1]